MARNGSGTYSRPVAPYVFDTVISETDVNSEMDDIATALTDSIAADGQTNPTANLPMAGYRHTGVGAATAQDHYARIDQVQNGSLGYLTSVGGTADAITATAALSMAGLTVGQLFHLIPAASNTAVDPTININAIGAGTITKAGGGALVAGDIRENWPAIIQRVTGGFELLNPYTVASGQIQANAVTTAKILDANVTDAKMATQKVSRAGDTMTGALQNVVASESGGFGHISLGRGTGAGDRGLIVTSPDGSNGVSEVQIRVGSSIIARAIKSSERLRLLGAPADDNDAATKAYVDAATNSTDSGELAWTAGGVVTLDLGVAVKDFEIYVKCKNGSAISGISVDDLVVPPTYLSTTLRGIQGAIRGTTVRARVGSGGINLADGSGVPQTASATDFPIIIRAWPR
jgi:hypothetical protein